MRTLTLFGADRRCPTLCRRFLYRVLERLAGLDLDARVILELIAAVPLWCRSSYTAVLERLPGLDLDTRVSLELNTISIYWLRRYTAYSQASRHNHIYIVSSMHGISDSVIIDWGLLLICVPVCQVSCLLLAPAYACEVVGFHHVLAFGDRRSLEHGSTPCERKPRLTRASNSSPGRRSNTPV